MVKMPDSRVGQDKQDEIARVVRSYERRCEDLWGEMIWELGMDLDLEEEIVERIAREAVGS